MDFNESKNVVQRIIEGLLITIIGGIVVFVITTGQLPGIINRGDESDTSYVEDEATKEQNELSERLTALSDGSIEFNSRRSKVSVKLPGGWDYEEFSSKDTYESLLLQYSAWKMSIKLNIEEMMSDNQFRSVDDYYAYYNNLYQSNYGDDLAYNAHGKNFAVFSYYTENKTVIHYEKTWLKDDFWCTLEFTYPEVNRTVCDSIVEQFSRQF